MSWRRLIRDERGTTLAEMMVAIATATVVLLGLTTLVVVTLHSSTRVRARVDSTQRSRTTLTRLVDELHSACIAPKVSPVVRESTGSVLKFVHASGSEVVPIPTLSVVSLSAGTLTQTDYAWKEGSAPFWVFKSTPSATTQLMTNVAPLAGKPIFTYYAYSSGAVSEVPLMTPLSEIDAARTIHVGVAFSVAPKAGAGSDEGTPAHIQDGASLRLSAASYNKEAPSLPCQ